jgi:hypothetical protein
MQSKQEDRDWIHWILRQMMENQTVIRLSLYKVTGGYQVNALLAMTCVVEDQVIAGVISYDSSLVGVTHRHGLRIPATIKYATEVGSINRTAAMLEKHCDWRREWMTESKTLCVLRDHFKGPQWEAIPTHGILALHHLSNLQGMVAQAYAGAEKEDEFDFLCASSFELDLLLSKKFDELAGITAGMN